ncbi:hypothetical protein BH20BAC1_BH20BAC1_08760 [soil metagenome]
MGKFLSKKNAKVLVLISDDQASDKDWLSTAMEGKAFDFLNDSAEDIYTMEDGEPYDK